MSRVLGSCLNVQFGQRAAYLRGELGEKKTWLADPGQMSTYAVFGSSNVLPSVSGHVNVIASAYCHGIQC